MIIDLSKINFGGGGGGETAKLQKKSMTVSSATATIVPDAGYDGMTKVDVDATEYGTSNYNDGVLAQKAKLTEINITENGTYTKEDGYSNVVVDVKAPTETVDLKTGIKFGSSTFSAMPFTLICDSGVTDMNLMFYACYKLTTLDVSNFDTSNVTNMYAMFESCSNLTTLDLSNFDTSKVYDMGRMFIDCNSLTTVKVINCDESTKNKILTKLQSDLSSYTWTLGDDGIIRRSETT